jgi:hypothetical protein
MMNTSVEQLKEDIAEKVSAYQLNVVTRDGTETLSADQVDLKYDDQGEVDQLLKNQNAFLWFLFAATSEDDYSVNVAMDESKCELAIADLSCMQEANMTAPTDAHLEYEDGSFVIVPQTQGNTLDTTKTVTVIEDAIYEGLTEVSLDDAGSYVAPTVYEDDANLSKEQEEANQLLGAVITYDFGDRSEVVDSDLISQWLVFSDDFSVTLDEDLIYDYVHDLGLKYDTFGLSRTFKTHSGNTITLKGGDYGWCIHKDKTTAQLKELILAGETTETEPIYLYSGVCRDTNDIGGTYVEVSIADQTMWCYKDGECVVSTPVVTGNSSRNYDTPSGGVWAIDARISPYTLTGQDYNTEVTYWLPFNGNVGIHDATWRSEFGGSIYKTSGSHGCVNTPKAAMKIVYETMRIGYPVVVY